MLQSVSMGACSFEAVETGAMTSVKLDSSLLAVVSTSSLLLDIASTTAVSACSGTRCSRLMTTADVHGRLKRLLSAATKTKGYTKELKPPTTK